VPMVRTCVGCRVRTDKSDLLRVVGRGDSIVPDPRAQLLGRGAYLHLSQACFEQAQRRKAFARALRLPGPIRTTELEDYLARRCGAAESQVTQGSAQKWQNNGISAGGAGSDCDERPMSMRR